MINTNITFCIPSNNNLKYLQHCIPSIRNNAFNKNHEIIVFVDRDTDGTTNWLNKNKNQYNITYYSNNTNKNFGIAKSYDICIEHSSHDIIMVFHADMILGKDADYHALKYMNHKTVVCSTRIEPPLFPSAGEKLINDFGIWPENFDYNNFNKYVEDQKNNNINKITNGIFAPWMIYKKDFYSLGGHDHSLMNFKEDSDIFNRMKLNGYNLIQSWESFVYHFTGRGGRFANDKIDYFQTRDIELASERKFIRKWGSQVRSTPMLDPIVEEKYNIGLIINNLSLDQIKKIEPFFDNIYYDISNQQSVNQIISDELVYDVNISDKFIMFTDIDKCANDIIVILNQNINFLYITNIHSIIKEINNIGQYNIDNQLYILIKNINNTLVQYLI